jgi:hypothetical protein
MSLIILLAIIIVPALVLIFLKINAVFVYLALCLGAVLSQFVSNNHQLNSLVSKSTIVNQYLGGNSNIRLGLVVVPPILVAVFMIRTAKGRKLSLNIVTSISVGFLAAFLVIPLLPLNTSTAISSLSAWTQLSKFEGPIVGISSVLILILLIVQRPKHGSSVAHQKHHKG